MTIYRMTYIGGVYRIYRDDFNKAIPWFASPTKKYLLEYIKLSGINPKKIAGFENVSERRRLYQRMPRVMP